MPTRIVEPDWAKAERISAGAATPNVPAPAIPPSSPRRVIVIKGFLPVPPDRSPGSGAEKA
jgi:hypothetical protein